MAPPSWFLSDDSTHGTVSRNGYCETTTHREQGCKLGARKGVWPLRGSALESWDHAATECISKCKSCEACSAISFSRKNGECGWFASCAWASALHKVPYGFRTILMADLPNSSTITRTAPHSHARLDRKPIAVSSCNETSATEKDVSFFWKGRGQLGNRFESALNALQTGACCATRVFLPKALLLGGEVLPPRTSTCVSFQKRDGAPLAAACQRLMPQNSDHFYYDELKTCRSNTERRADAQLAGLRYAQSFGALSCAAPLPRDTLVAHVRCGDGVVQGFAHIDFGQPPVAYYLAAWRTSGLSRLLVVTKDEHCAVARSLRMLSSNLGLNITVQSSERFEDDLQVLMCARHMVLAHSTLSTLILGGNPHLHTVYSYRQLPVTTWLASCKTKYLFAPGTPREKQWTGSAEQQLETVASGGFEALTFQRALRPPCLGWT